MTANDDDIAAALHLLAKLGVTPEDLLAKSAGQHAGTGRGTTLRDYVTDALDVLKKSNAGTHGTYSSPLGVLVDGLPDLCECPCVACVNHDLTCPCTELLPAHHPNCAGGNCSDRFLGAGDLRLDELTLSILERGQQCAQLRADKRTKVYNARRSAAGRTLLERDGRGAGENYVGAVRWLLRRAEIDRHVSSNLGMHLAKPDRLASEPRQLTIEQLDELFSVATTTGRDPELDGLLLWADLVTASRASGLINMTVGRLDRETAVNATYEKKVRNRHRVAVTPALVEALLAHATDRGPRKPAPRDAPAELRKTGVPDLRADSPLFYRRPDDTYDEDGNFASRVVHPVTVKRLETLRTRIKRNLAWADDRQLRWHDLRHTTGALLERVAGKAIVAAQLGHIPSDPTDAYTVATLQEQAAAIARLFDSDHPLLPKRPARELDS